MMAIELCEGEKVFKTIRFHGIPIAIDRPTGFVQKGESSDGKKWERTYKNDYGFIEGTRGGIRKSSTYSSVLTLSREMSTGLLKSRMMARLMSLS
jgi:hypothetical protein